MRNSPGLGWGPAKPHAVASSTTDLKPERGGGRVGGGLSLKNVCPQSSPALATHSITAQAQTEPAQCGLSS